jgi:hypothetical protein
MIDQMGTSTSPDPPGAGVPAPARPRRSFEFSPLYRPAVLGCLAVQAFLFILTGLMLDFGRMNKLCAIVIVAQWIGFFVVLGRRPLSPTQSDLWFIRWGSVPLLLAAPWIAIRVYAVIGTSSLSGLERLLGVTLRR